MGTSLARRANPKLISSCLTGQTTSTSSERFDGLGVDHRYRLHTKDLGHLYGLCDAVPYLVGPRPYLRSMSKFGAYPLPIEAYQDRHGRMALDSHKLSALDKVFLTMLHLLSMPFDRRPPEAASWFAGISLRGNRLVVHKDIGFGREPKEIAINTFDFLDMALGWQRLPNPALVAEDRPDAVTPWHIVVDKLRAGGISLRDIDVGLYVEFVQMNEDELDAKVTRLSSTNELALRKRQLADSVRRLSMPTSYTHTIPRPVNPNVIYAKRFSREHPLGYIPNTVTQSRESLPMADPGPVQTESSREEAVATLRGPEMEHAKRTTSRQIQRVCLWLLGCMTLIGAVAGIALMMHFKRNLRPTGPGS